jgi:hypothetical protein
MTYTFDSSVQTPPRVPLHKPSWLYLTRKATCCNRWQPVYERDKEGKEDFLTGSNFFSIFAYLTYLTFLTYLLYQT